ncbi:MAG: pilus assembly protein PilM [Phycisphaerales bacterium JB043]
MPIGVELNTRCVRLLQLRRDGGKLSVIDGASMPIEVGDEGLSSQAYSHEMRKAMRAMLSEHRFRGRHCLVSIDESLVRVRSVRQPRMPDDEMNQAVCIEAPDRLGVDPSMPMQVDWLRAGEVRHGDEIREEVLLVGCERSPLEKLVDELISCGISPMSVEPSFVAIGRTFSRMYQRASDRATVRMVLHVGNRSTRVLVLAGPDVVFYKRIEVGGAEFSEIAAERMGLDLETIESLRRQRMIAQLNPDVQRPEEKVDRAIYTSVRPHLSMLAEEISRCARYFAVTFCSPRPSLAIVVGEHAAEPGLVQIVSDAIGLDTSIGQPFDNIAMPSPCPVALQHITTSWAAPIGLCLRGRRQVKRRRAA